MKRITIYTDSDMAKSYMLNTAETKDLLDKILSSPNFDISIIIKEY